VLATLEPLIERGQRTGAFRADLPLSMLMALVHAASAALRAKRLAEEEVRAAMLATVLGALSAPSAV
jgi:hypothetical protein